MGAFLAYTIQASIVMTIMFVCYKILLSSATFHILKRFVLLAIIVCSWTLPALLQSTMPIYEIQATTTGIQDISSNKQKPMVEVGIPIQVNISEQKEQTPSPWWYRFSLLYGAGATAVLIFSIASALKLTFIIRQGNKNKYPDYTQVISDSIAGPFSWGKYIVLRNSDCDSDLPLVIAHELRHISHLHWLDLLVSRLNIICMWFNPIAYLLQRELRCVHEFEADRSIPSCQLRCYQLMLIKKTVGSSFPTLANSLNHSQIYSRITMMMKNKSKSARRLAVLALPGAALLSLIALSQPSVANVINKLKDASQDGHSIGKITQNPSDEQIIAAVNVLDSASDHSDDSTTSAITLVSAQDSEIKVTTDNSESQPTLSEEKGNEIPAIFVNGELHTGNLQDINPASIQSITVVKNDPAYPSGKLMIELESSNVAVDAAEQCAEFKGGHSAMAEWITQNLKYPPEAIKNNAEGRVIVKFVVETDGSISSPVILRGISPELDNEALRLVKEMPAWIPARNNGQPVASNYVLPISFKLTADGK